MKFDIKNRWTDNVIFTADIDCSEDENYSVKLGLAVKIAIKSEADLTEADLRYANLRYADLRYADLTEAVLRYADLTRADLRYADLRYANLRYADLTEAVLTGADLRYADLTEQPPQTIVPSEGELVVYKKLKEGIAKLKIPAEARRLSSTTRKCRAEYAVVLELPEGVENGHSKHDENFIYRVGETIRPTEPFDDDWRVECASGIHFFITRREAEQY